MFTKFPYFFLAVKIPSVFSLRFGWYGFNPGSTLTMKSGSDGALAAQVAMNTTLAAATGGITVFLLRDWAAVRRVEAKKLVDLVNHQKQSDVGFSWFFMVLPCKIAIYKGKLDLNVLQDLKDIVVFIIIRFDVCHYWCILAIILVSLL